MVSQVEASINARNLSDLYWKKHKFICIPTRNKMPLVRGWQKLTAPYQGSCWSDCNGVGILTGKKTGITVVDVDAPDRAWFDKFVEHFKIKPTTWVLTPGNGYHLYFRYSQNLPNGKFKGMDIDIRNSGGQIIAPRSHYFTADAKKKNANGQVYRFKDDLDFSKLRDLDDVFIKMYNFGIDRETFEIGTKPIVYQKPELLRLRKQSKNQALFMRLLQAYEKQNGSGYQVWLNGVWCICGASEENRWDAEKLAIDWSSKMNGFDGQDAVIKKVREYKPHRGRFGIDFLLRNVPPKDQKEFEEGFEREYFYHDYIVLLKKYKPYMNMEILKKYFHSSIIRVDRMGSPSFYLRKRDGTWHPNQFPFKGDMTFPFKYQVANPNYDDRQPSGPNNSLLCTKMSSFRAELVNYQVSLKNFEDIQYYPHYGEDPTPFGTFNVFNGYRHEIFSATEFRKFSKRSDFKFLMNHWLETMCNNNAEFFEYVMNWLSWLLKYGWKKPSTAIVMHGREGLGKGLMWCNLVWKGILGESQGAVHTDMARFCEKFNLQRLNKSIHIFNECTSIKSGSRVSWDKMKAIVSDRDITAEPKGKEAFHAIDCAGCVMTGNHEHLVNVSNSDRRYACVEMNDKHKGKASYFKRLARVVDDTIVQRTFFTYLINRSVEDFFMGTIPETASRKNMKESKSENNILTFLRKLVTGTLEKLVKKRWFKDPAGFFDHNYNEKKLVPQKKCWYAQTVVLKCYHKWLDYENVAQRFRKGRSRLVSMLDKHGLQRIKRTDRSWHHDDSHYSGEVKTCWYICKDSIRSLHRSWLNNPEWDFPPPEVGQALSQSGGDDRKEEPETESN